MSEEENMSLESTEPHLLTAEYKDGQLQIVEVSAYNGNKNDSILPDMLMSTGSDQHKYMQVLDPNKGLVQLDLFNFTLVRCEDGDESYRLITNSESDGDLTTDGTVTCVLQSSDGEEQGGSEYVMVEEDQTPLVLLQSSDDKQELLDAGDQGFQTQQQQQQQMEISIDINDGETSDNTQSTTKKLSPQQLLDKLKMLQKEKSVRSLLWSQSVRVGRRGRRRLSDAPPAALLQSPHFKLYLYSCKLCSFKCNAVKDLAAHRQKEHLSGGRGSRGGATSGRAQYITLQCAKCPFRGVTHTQLLKHVQYKHADEPQPTISLDTKEVQEADVLVCGACGFESSDRTVFKDHIINEHGATPV